MVLRVQTAADQDDRIVIVKGFRVEGSPPPFINLHRPTFCAACTELGTPDYAGVTRPIPGWRPLKE